MSGGVDSAVCAAVLLSQGWQVEGVFLRFHALSDDALQDAQKVADFLKIPLTVWDARAPFADIVIKDFVDNYVSGRTPNPCALCNPTVKFKQLAAAADALGCDRIATGHYATVCKDENGWFSLHRKSEQKKDQSYALYRLSQEILSRLVLPLGEFSDKEQVRQKAVDLALPVADKPDSQETCFIPADLSPAAYISQREGRALCPGHFVNREGQVLGEHKDITFYTVGQRRGLGISAPSRLFVQKICPDTNTVVLGEEDDLWQTEVKLEKVFLNVLTPASRYEITAKIRYNDTDTPAVLTLEKGDRAGLVFESPKRAIAPGQSAVFYQNDTILGGGIIERQA